jgi:ABC-type Zn2+ transport system substrate-binding protein/surface adhesin
MLTICYHHEHSHGEHHHHDHEHSHEHCHAHHHDCGSCGGCDPMQEAVALMDYMVKHNTAHANELATLAKRLEELGNSAASAQVMAAVSEFEKGNLRLATVLASLR